MKENKFISNGNTFVLVKPAPKVNVKELIKKRKKK